jgi:hypothetical protein
MLVRWDQSNERLSEKDLRRSREGERRTPPQRGANVILQLASAVGSFGRVALQGEDSLARISPRRRKILAVSRADQSSPLIRGD